ncbi:hypothetical protein AAFF_G00339080 [Aldrovandia affinis]|uniref:G-protein coupled receptors family 1 profile domain-containing protein n=1 Tax=Aldrovandia affinis TaxID=143900 RepID=A0AAD7SK50_9TELE|nr:hypothetical protein AAFF_G00339080 [Aldrovandia affinis]
MEASHAAFAAPAPTVSPVTPAVGYLFLMFREYQDNSVIVAHYNYTGKLTGNKYRNGLKPEAIVFLVICLLIVLENAVVLVAIWKNKKFHLPMYYLLGNLTLSDLLAGFTYMVNLVTSGANTLRLTPVLWFLREGGVFITLAASVISLLAIAIERHVTMVRMKPYQGAKRGRMFGLIGASWVVAALLGVLPIAGWNCMGGLEGCSTVLPLYAKSYLLFCVSVFIGILLAIVVLYARIFRIVKSNTQRLGGGRRHRLRRATQGRGPQVAEVPGAAEDGHHCAGRLHRLLAAALLAPARRRLLPARRVQRALQGRLLPGRGHRQLPAQPHHLHAHQQGHAPRYHPAAVPALPVD